jgi:hypothetical protein
MSRYTIPLHAAPHLALVVGWDAPLQTYFAQVFDSTVPSDAETDCVLWIGDDPTQPMTSVAALQAHLEYQIPAHITLALRKDALQAHTRSPLQHIMAELFAQAKDSAIRPPHAPPPRQPARCMRGPASPNE